MSSAAEKVAEREAAYKVYWASDVRRAKTAAWLSRWEREFAHLWVHTPGKGYSPRKDMAQPLERKPLFRVQS
jgi:hypothetical protein